MTFGDDRLPQRFWNKVIPEPNTGCWLWMGCTTLDGYGRIYWNRRVTQAHRVTSELIHTFVHGQEADHRCRTRCCVNPMHIEPVTHDENVRRQTRPICKRGHFKNGRKWCPTCVNAGHRRSYHQHKVNNGR